MEIPYEDYVEHHGVKNQKWGEQHGPPYPLDRNAARQARKAAKAERRAKRQAEKEAAKRKKKRAESLKKARETKQRKKQEAAEQAKREAEEKKRKEKILQDPKKLYKHRKEFTKEEIQDALQRFEWEQKVQSYSTTRLENTAKKAQSLVKIMTAGVGGYNTVAGAYNAFFPDSKLPIIDLGGKKKKNNSGGGGDN